MNDLSAEVTQALREAFRASKHPEPAKTIYKLMDALEDILELCEPRSVETVDGPNAYKMIREICYRELGHK
jgi:hypothetical protein